MSQPSSSPSPSSALLRLHALGQRHPFLYYTLPLLLLALVIAGGSLAPPSQLPRAVTSVSDKLLHSLGYAAFGLLLLRGWTRETAPTRLACLQCGVIAVLFGAYLEVLQSFTPQRSFELGDMLANGLGALAGVSLWLARHGWRFTPGAGPGQRAGRPGPSVTTALGD